MEYPKYKREQKATAKLSEKDVISCKQLKSYGLYIKQIAKLYNMSPSGMRYVLMTDEEKKQYNKNQYLGGIGKKFVKLEIRKKFLTRKRKKFGKKLKEWQNFNAMQYEKKYPNRVFIRKKKYRENNKKSIAKKLKEWNFKNREYVSNYKKEYYLKNIKRIKQIQKLYRINKKISLEELK